MMLIKQRQMARHYTKQLATLGVERKRILTKPVTSVTHHDLIDLEEIDSTIHKYRERLRKVQQELLYDEEDSRIFDL